MSKYKTELGQLIALHNILGESGIKSILSGEATITPAPARSAEQKAQDCFAMHYTKMKTLKEFLRGWGKYEQVDGLTFEVRVLHLVDKLENLAVINVASGQWFSQDLEYELSDSLEEIIHIAIVFQTMERINLPVGIMEILKTAIRAKDNLKVLIYAIRLEQSVSTLDDMVERLIPS